MTASELHGDDDEFGDDAEFPGEGGVDGRVTERQADGTVGGNDFEEDGEKGESVIVGVFDTVAFHDGDDEES